MCDGMMLTIDADGFAQIYDDTYDIVIHCESEEEKNEVIKKLNSMNWIPCSERLPEEGVSVLCCFWNKGNYKMIVSSRRDYNYWSGVGRTGDIVAWMPLPTPYEGRQE